MSKLDLFGKLYLLFGRLFYRLKIRDLDNVPETGPCIIAFNHAAPIVDGLTIAAILRRRSDTILFGGTGLPRGGPLQKRMSGIMLSAYKARRPFGWEVLKALDFLAQGRPISLAAEGELTWDGQLQYPLAPGAAWMALKAHVPVVAVVSKGGYDIMPRWATAPKLTGRVTIRAGLPFYLSDSPADCASRHEVGQASQRIYDVMAALIAQPF